MQEFLSEEDKQQIVDKLKERGANIVCPMCKNSEFFLADGYFNQKLTDGSDYAHGFIPSLNGATMPTVVLVCKNCGFVSQHALGVLKTINSNL